jgi:hypothetical protein
MGYGNDLRTPVASIDGPKTVLTDETAGSGEDYFLCMFKKMCLGPLIGQRTWGGLGDPGLTGADGRRERHGAQSDDLDPGRRIHRAERGGSAEHRRGADAQGRDRGAGSAA